MSPTNIRSGRDMISRTGSHFNDQAFIQPFNLPVHMTYVEFSQESVDKLSKQLNCGIEDVWVSNVNSFDSATTLSNDSFKVVEAGPSMKIPNVCVSLGFCTDRRSPTNHPPEEPLAPIGYIIVVQGRNASERSKLVTNSSRSDIANTMLQEAMNGYCIVFSGALFRSSLREMFPLVRSAQTFKFTRVNGVTGLNKLAAENGTEGQGEIGIIC